MILRDALSLASIVVDPLRGLYTLQAVVNIVYQSDTLMMTTASTLIANIKYSSGRSSATFSRAQIEDTSTTKAEPEPFWRRVDKAYRRFPEQKGYNGIFAESPNLSEVHKAYITY